MYRFSEYFGWLNIALPIGILLWLPFTEAALSHDKASLTSILIMQILVGSSMVYSSRKKSQGLEIGYKAYPASIAAFVLFALIAYRWFVSGV